MAKRLLQIANAEGLKVNEVSIQKEEIPDFPTPLPLLISRLCSYSLFHVQSVSPGSEVLRDAWPTCLYDLNLYSQIALEELAERCNGDIRMALNQLHYMSLSMSVIRYDDIRQRLLSSAKDEDISPFTAVDKYVAMFSFFIGLTIYEMLGSTATRNENVLRENRDMRKCSYRTIRKHGIAKS